MSIMLHVKTVDGRVFDVENVPEDATIAEFAHAFVERLLPQVSLTDCTARLLHDECLLHENLRVGDELANGDHVFLHLDRGCL